MATAAKAFVLHFGEALNHELGGTGVHCTVLSPRVTATEFLARRTEADALSAPGDDAQRGRVRVGLRAMLRGEASLVPGLLNKLTAFSVRFLPRRWATAVAALTMGNPARDRALHPSSAQG